MSIKNYFLSTIAILCLINTTVLASNKSDLLVKTTGEDSFVIQFSTENQTSIQVILKDDLGETLFNEKQLKNNLSQRKYNLQNLPSGEYTLYVVYDAIVKVQAITKEENKLKIEAEKMETVFSPVFRQHLQYLDLTMLNLSKLKVLIKITDSEGNVVYCKINRPSPTLKNRFNLSSLEEGTYKVSVKVMDSGLIKEFNEFVEWSPAETAK